MKRLIVTADDLGLHRAMTEGALRAHDDGIVTAVSVSSCGRDVEHAVRELSGRQSLDVGIHFTLVEERPVLPPGEVRSLVGRDGCFHRSYAQFMARWITGRIDLDEVDAELRAQASLLRDAGLALVHANGHQHLHVLPGVLRRVLSVARASGIRYVRSPVEYWVGSPRVGPRVASLNVLRSLSSAARRAMRRHGFVTNERTIGIANAGRLTRAAIERQLPLVTGVSELVTHPGSGNAAIAEAYRWGYDWEGETEALCDPRLRESLTNRGIELARPSDVA